MRIVYTLLILFAAAGGLVSCRSSQRHSGEETEQPSRLKRIPFPQAVPDDPYAAETGAEWLRDHFWERFDFSDTTLLVRIDTSEMYQSFANYTFLVGPEDEAAMRTLFEKAAVSTPMLTYFGEMARDVLHDPNSPLRSDRLYVPVLEVMLASGRLGVLETAVAETELRRARLNREGEPANDFRYETLDGRRGHLYGLKADYVLLFFNNPGCPMCRDLTTRLTESQLLSGMVERGELVLLSLYPDEDLDAWRKDPHAAPRWIAAHDEARQISEKELYDLKAIPSLYLLDREKRVLVKDADAVERIEWEINRRKER